MKKMLLMLIVLLVLSALLFGCNQAASDGKVPEISEEVNVIFGTVQEQGQSEAP